MTSPQLYLICFVVGFVLALLGALGGTFHWPFGAGHGASHGIPLPHAHGGGAGHGGAPAHGGAGGVHVSPYNFATVMGFLAVFGGVGYLLSSRGRLGNLVVLGHGSAGATLFGHLGRVDVRRGQRVRRGERLAAVGNSGWAMSPTLHYEYWRRNRAGVAPTDPRFAVLDRKLIDDGMSLEKMLATSSPDPGEPPPGL